MSIEYVQELYREMHEEFPEVKMTEYNVNLDEDGEVGVITSYEGIVNGTCPLEFDQDFVSLPREVQKAIIAHEYGHLKRYQGMDPDEVQYIINMANGFDIVMACAVAEAQDAFEEGREPEELDDDYKIVLEEALEDEMLADSEAAKKGFAQPNLDYLQAQYEQFKDNPIFKISPMKDHLEGRIKNLEDSLQ